MLTRLQINGFKNLVDVDVRFGPFTCIAGPNGVGKSNVFDAIQFLAELGRRFDQTRRLTDRRSPPSSAGQANATIRWIPAHDPRPT